MEHSTKSLKKQQKILILSFGHAGSKWLAQTLHKLDNVFCTVGNDHPLESLAYWHNKDEFNHLLSLVQKGFFNKYGCSDFLAKTYGFQIAPRISDHWNVIMDETEELSKHFRPKCEYIINVHGLTTYNYLRSIYKNDKEIKIHELIRHPITTVESHIKASLNSWNIYPFTRPDYIKRLTPHIPTLAVLSSDLKIDFSDISNVLAYLGFCFIAGVAQALQKINCPRIKFEDLKTKPSYFSDFYQALFGNAPTSDYIDFVYSKENLGSGRISSEDNSAAPLEAKEQYAEWSDDKKRLFKAIVQPEHLKAYEQYHYDFSFLL